MVRCASKSPAMNGASPSPHNSRQDIKSGALCILLGAALAATIFASGQRSPWDKADFFACLLMAYGALRILRIFSPLQKRRRCSTPIKFGLLAGCVICQLHLAYTGWVFLSSIGPKTAPSTAEVVAQRDALAAWDEKYEKIVFPIGPILSSALYGAIAGSLAYAVLRMKGKQLSDTRS